MASGNKRNVERNAEVMRLKARGRTNAEISREFGIGQQRVGDIIRAEIQRTMGEEDREAVRQVELAKLDELEREAWKVLEGTHLAYTQKGLVKTPLDENGEPAYLQDPMPVLAAMDRILKIQERRAKMLGIDAPTRIQITGDLIEQEIKRLEAALAGNDSNSVAEDVDAP